MRAYLHTVEEPFVVKGLERYVSRLAKNIDQALRKQPKLAYYLSTAASSVSQAIATAWALEEDDAVAYFRDLMGQIGSMVTERFSASEIRDELGFVSLGHFGLATDPALVRRLAAIIHEASRGNADTDGWAEEGVAPFSRSLASATAALIVGNDELARSMAARANDSIHDPANPPGLHVDGLPHAIDAVTRNDSPALAQAADHTIALYVERFGPSKDMRAGATSLLYPGLTTICRAAGWRRLTIPDRPYIMPIADDPLDHGRSA